MIKTLLALAVLAQSPGSDIPAPPTPYPPAPPPAAPTVTSTTTSESTQTTAPAVQNPGCCEEKPLGAFVPDEGFRIKDASGDNMLRFGLQATYKFDPLWTNGEPQLRSGLGFMRPILRGNLVKPWITFWVSTELAGNPPYLLDSYFDVVPQQTFGIRVGQQYSPYDRHEQLGPQQLFFPEWAPVPEYFWPGRDKGVQVYGLLLDKKLEYYAEISAGTPLRQIKSIPGNYVAHGRIAINPLGPTNVIEFPFTDKGEPLPTRISFSLEGYTGKQQTAVENFNDTNGQLKTVPTGDYKKQTSGAVDMWFQSGPFLGQVDAHYRHVDLLDGSTPFNQFAIWGQGIFNVWHNIIGLGVQANYVDPDLAVANDSVFVGQLGFDWFIKPPTLVFKARYAYVFQQDPGIADVTLPYTAGTTHIGTVCMALAF